MTVRGLPQEQLGCALPLGVADHLHHEFYAVSGFDVAFVGYPGSLASFDPADGRAALRASWPALEFLAGREVDRISIGGLPVVTTVPRDEVLQLCQEATDKLGVPVTTDAEDTVLGLEAIGARSVVIATKWADEVVDNVERYFTEAGFEVRGRYSIPRSADKVIAMKPVETYEIALALGDGALSGGTDADALLLGGGAWYVTPAIPVIEERYGVPVVNNTAAMIWAFLRQVGRAPVGAPWGRLLDGLGS